MNPNEWLFSFLLKLMIIQESWNKKNKCFGNELAEQSIHVILPNGFVQLVFFNLVGPLVLFPIPLTMGVDYSTLDIFTVFSKKKKDIFTGPCHWDCEKCKETK